MKKIGIASVVLFSLFLTIGCGAKEEDKALETAAPPAGSNAVAEPGKVDKNRPGPAGMGGGGGAAATAGAAGPSGTQ